MHLIKKCIKFNKIIKYRSDKEYANGVCEGGPDKGVGRVREVEEAGFVEG